MPDLEQQNLQAEIDKIHWYHEFDFGNGLKAKTDHYTEGHRLIWEFITRNLNTVDFRGKSVLDIGSWDGYWAFECEKRGAKSILATDDSSQNWSQGTGIHLAKKLLKSNIDINQNLSVYNLSSLNQKFDIVLYLGVYYHLHDPFYAFSQIRHCCHENTIVLIDGPIGLPIGYNSSVYDFRYHDCEFLPGMGALTQLVEANYLRPIDSQFIFAATSPQNPDAPKSPDLQAAQQRPGFRWRLKAAWNLLFSSTPSQDVLINSPDATSRLVETFNNRKTKDIATNRVFLKCRPFTGENTIHVYRPPFGLHAYDDRFKGR